MLKYIQKAYIWNILNDNILISLIATANIYITLLEIFWFVLMLILLGYIPLNIIVIRALIFCTTLQVIPIIIYKLNKEIK